MQGARALTRSQLGEILAPDFFLWATGIEDTFITDPHRETGRALDEYELTQHYELWREDIDLIASLGVGYARYGIPWHRIEASPGKFDFSWPDQAFERMLAKGVQPIVDLVHYGVPAWLEGGFGNPDYPSRVAAYAAAIAKRYRGVVSWYTPLNEPRITAYYCGRIGWWPPYGRCWRDFVRLMVSIAKGIVLTQRTLHEIDSEIVSAHVDATDIYRPASPDLADVAGLRQSVVFLALDLVTGRVDESHELYSWLIRHGLLEADLAWFRDRRIEPDLIGLNLYPMFTNKIVQKSKTGIRMRMPYVEGSIVEELGRMYWERYRKPVFVSETASVGRGRGKWLEDSLDSVRSLRQQGIPMVGYTWWPLFALVAWAYREKDLPFDKYLFQLGLWDLAMEEDGRLSRVPTGLEETYRRAVAAGCERVGRLKVGAR